MSITTDNNVLAYINLIDKDKEAINTEGISDFAMDSILNWSQTPESARREQIPVIAARLDSLRKEGFSNSEAEEMLVFAGFPLAEIREVISDSEPEETEISTKIAEKYEDLKSNIENVVVQMDPESFMEIATANRNPEHGIVRLASRESMDLETLLRYISARKDNGPVAMASLNEDLHEIIRPFVEEELFRSQLEAQVNRDIPVTSQRNGEYKVAGKYYVNMDEKTCTCDKFSKSHFDIFGIPCEHILLVNEIVNE